MITGSVPVVIGTPHLTPGIPSGRSGAVSIGLDIVLNASPGGP